MSLIAFPFFARRSIIASLAILGTAGYVAWSKVSGGDKKRRGYTGAYDPKTGLGRGAPGFRESNSKRGKMTA